MNKTQQILFDEPGPRAQRRIRIATVLGAVLLVGAVVAAVYQFASHGELAAARWEPFTTWPIWRYLLNGLWATLRAAAATAVLSAALGLLLALGRLSTHRPLRWLAGAYVEIFRTVPTLLLIYVTLFALPQYGLNFPLFWKLVVPLVVSNSAAFAEIFRSGILALDRGQTEAGLAVGLRRGQVMALVVLPQALLQLAPSLVSQLVGLLKDTSLGFVVSYTELLYSGQVLSSYTHLLIQTFLVVALIYLVVNASLSKFARVLQARNGRFGGRRGRRTAELPPPLLEGNTPR
ncbi:MULTISPECIES: amino acid ABC transporter permease [Micromonospora]|uniref:amino acid ABC transporter permease n=1 Tax=Micromonospora TaxID=1873 RepID=UPI001EE92338|nr:MULTISPECIES: amino acid ABC transporter permease [Micromonospora]MCG5450183.1 amino acid ABC transporter permease [Micromonospora hortensis]MCX5118365.1 amino acid ABC transporter permease [Micromonospora sp. NBC_00362]WTI09469.1 amino acid ABC transporter permease [Micromonospora sp. NBC_00821]